MNKDLLLCTALDASDDCFEQRVCIVTDGHHESIKACKRGKTQLEKHFKDFLLSFSRVSPLLFSNNNKKLKNV